MAFIAGAIAAEVNTAAKLAEQNSQFSVGLYGQVFPHPYCGISRHLDRRICLSRLRAIGRLRWRPLSWGLTAANRTACRLIEDGVQRLQKVVPEYQAISFPSVEWATAERQSDTGRSGSKKPRRAGGLYSSSGMVPC